MRVDYRKLKVQVRLKDLLKLLGWASSEGRGEQLRGPCPLPRCQSTSTNTYSTDSDRCFSVHTEKNIYHCFHCASSGNVIDFWSAYRGITFGQAAIELNNLTQPSFTQPHSSPRPTIKS
jgi:hypothetical protein